MRRKKKKNNFLAVLSSKLFCFVLILILAGVVKISFDKFLVWKEAREIILSKEEAIKKEEGKVTEFKEFLDYYQSQEYFERTIKEKLNLVRPGEKVIYVLPGNGKEEEPIKNKSLLEKLKKIFVK